MKRFDGRLVILGLVVVGGFFVVLNLLLGKGPSGVRVIESPRSSAASPGVSYPVRLLSPCAEAVDFDGSFWASEGDPLLRQPAEPATAELRDQEHVLLQTASGQRLVLVRLDPPLRLAPCPSPTS